MAAEASIPRRMEHPFVMRRGAPRGLGVVPGAPGLDQLMLRVNVVVVFLMFWKLLLKVRLLNVAEPTAGP